MKERVLICTITAVVVVICVAAAVLIFYKNGEEQLPSHTGEVIGDNFADDIFG